MSSKIIDVKSFVADLRLQIKNQVIELNHNHQLQPKLAVVLVGNDPASEVYVGQKIKATEYCQMVSVQYRLEESTGEAQLLELIDQLNQDDSINGILVQLPLPKQIDETKVINAINPLKDVDGFQIQNIGRLHSQQNQLVPCTPLGCSLLLDQHFGAGGLSGKTAVVIGRSRIVGRPMAELLLQRDCTVIQAHSRTPNSVLNQLTQSADIVIVCVGIAHFLKKEQIKPGSVVIDVGINRIQDQNGKSKLVGDVDFDDVLDSVSAITPVPGGVGLLTVSCLMLNTYKATCLQHQIDS